MSFLDEHRENIDKYINISDMFQLLSIVFRYPTEDLAKGLEGATVLSDMRDCFLAIGGEEEAIADASSCFENPCNLHDLRVEYTRLYLVPKTEKVSLYEGVFRFEPGESKSPQMFIDPITLHVEQLYKKAGIVSAKAYEEPVDHICTEFEFMTYLYSSLIVAIEGEDETAASIWLERIAEFRVQHLNLWFGSFMQKTLVESNLVIYKGLAKLAIAFDKIY